MCFRYDTQQFGSCKNQYVAGKGGAETPRCVVPYVISIWRRTSTHWHSLLFRLLEGLWVHSRFCRKIFKWKWHLSSPIQRYNRPGVLRLGHVPPPPQGPQDNEGKLRGCSNFCVGYRNFTAWIKYLKFKIEAKVLFPLASPAARKAKLYFILDFKTSPCTDCCILTFGWFPDFWILYSDVSEHSVTTS